MKRTLLCLVALCSTFAIAPSIATAAPITPVVCATTDVTFRGANADACHGMVYSPANDTVGGDSTTWAVNTLPVFSGGWTHFVKDEGNSNTTSDYLGLNWSLQADVNSTSGDWFLTVAGPLPAGKDFPLSTDLMVVLKGSVGWSAYLFSPEIFTAFNTYDGEFTMRIQNRGGNVAELSHMSVYFRNGSLTDEPPCTVDCDPGDTVPEPTSMALLGLGLLGAGVFGRRKAQ